MIHSRLFTKYVEHDKTLVKYGAFDLETRGLAGEILGCGWAIEGGDVKLSQSPREMLAYMITARECRGIVWWAHNGGEFDFLHLWQPLRDLLEEKWPGKWIMHWTMRGDGKTIGLEVRVKEGEHRRRVLCWQDSVAILPTTLDQLAKGFAHTQKLTGTIDFAGGEVWDWNNEQHQLYLRSDVQSLLESMVNIRDLMWEQYHVELRKTAASTALRVFQAHLPEDVFFIRQREDHEAFVRKAQFGGFTFLTTIRQVNDVQLFDVNSLYPFVMRDREYPVGRPQWVDGSEFDRDNRLGIYECRVTMENQDVLPILPLRTKDGVMWPVGKFTTHLTTPEIKYARTQGYVVKVGRGIVYRDRSYLFREYVETLQSLKEQNAGTAKAALAKLLMNSTYGKFGQRRENEGIVVGEQEEVPPESRPLLDAQANPIPGLWLVPTVSSAPYIQPQIAAYVTAYARTYYHSLIQRAGGRRAVVYGDTDSMAVLTSDAQTDHLPIHPTRLGALKHEGSFATFRAYAPKTWEAARPDGSRVFRSKGIPRRLRRAGQEVVEWESLQGTRASLRRGEGPTLRRQHRSLPTLPTDKRWRVDEESGEVYPIWVK